MSAKPKSPSQSEWTIYAVIMLLILFVGAVSQALQVISDWKATGDQAQLQKPDGQKPIPPVANPPASSHTRQNEICGVWVSATSRKQYDFVCQEQGVFQVRQISGQGPKNRGSGKVTEDGKIEADLLVLPNNRTAHLKLQLSADGQKIEGTWHGDAPIESGKLTFNRVGKG